MIQLMVVMIQAVVMIQLLLFVTQVVVVIQLMMMIQVEMVMIQVSGALSATDGWWGWGGMMMVMVQVVVVVVMVVVIWVVMTEKSCTTEHIHNSYPQGNWSHIQTDCCAIDAGRNAGARVDKVCRRK